MTPREAAAYLAQFADPSEPVFVLRGQDRLAFATILDWAHRAENEGVNEDKVCSALKIAVEEFWEWRANHTMKLPD